MPIKPKTSKIRAKMKKLPAGAKNLSKEQVKRVKGGTTPVGSVVFTVDNNNQSSHAGTGVLRSTDSGKTWTL